MEGTSSFAEASWQPFTRTNRSPQSPFLIVEMVYCHHLLLFLTLKSDYIQRRHSEHVSKSKVNPKNDLFKASIVIESRVTRAKFLKKKVTVKSLILLVGQDKVNYYE